MTRHFNTAGPNHPSDHYSIDSFARINWPELQQLIDAKKFFVLHAPRQTGKTTLLQAIVDRLNGEGRYDTLRMNVEIAQAARNDVAMGDELIATKLVDQAEIWFP
ncbi:MAG: ATP-binding protein, partial [Polyangiaceae bacterium]|nr:ATP-binding protein [Polyangiaceae bacterium]